MTRKLSLHRNKAPVQRGGLSKADGLRDFRKRFIRLEMAVHDWKDLDYRSLTKFRYQLYLRGLQANAT